MAGGPAVDDGSICGHTFSATLDLLCMVPFRQVHPEQMRRAKLPLASARTDARRQGTVTPPAARRAQINPGLVATGRDGC
jgi:hypothetical protein